MRALPASKARPARAMGMKEPAIMRGSKNIPEPFFFLRADKKGQTQEDVRSNFLLHTNLPCLPLLIYCIQAVIDCVAVFMFLYSCVPSLTCIFRKHIVLCES
jgi:hypothetical protein